MNFKPKMKIGDIVLLEGFRISKDYKTYKGIIIISKIVHVPRKKWGDWCKANPGVRAHKVERIIKDADDDFTVGERYSLPLANWKSVRVLSPEEHLAYIL